MSILHIPLLDVGGTSGENGQVGVLMASDAMRRDDVSDWAAIHGEQQRTKYGSLGYSHFQTANIASSYWYTETSLAMSTLDVRSRVVQSHDVSPHNFGGLAMSDLRFSVAPFLIIIIIIRNYKAP